MSKPKAQKKAAPEPESKAPTEPKPKKGKAPKPDLVVFAFRLSSEDRDRIHKAAGPGKATWFVRTAALAAASGDRAGLEDLVKSSQK